MGEHMKEKEYVKYLGVLADIHFLGHTTLNISWGKATRLWHISFKATTHIIFCFCSTRFMDSPDSPDYGLIVWGSATT